jgi:hypothetical protein
VHKVPLVYNLTNDDMDRIDYQVWDTTEKSLRKQPGNRKSSTRRCRAVGNTTTALGRSQYNKRAHEKGGNVHNFGGGSKDCSSSLNQASSLRHKTLQIEMDAIEFPTT